MPGHFMTHLAPFRARILLTAFLLSLVPALQADEPKDLQKHLEQKLSKRAFIVRNFYGGDHLTFDINGTLIKGDKGVGYRGCWCASQLRVDKVEVKKDRVILRGPRVVGVYDTKKKDFSDLYHEGGNVQIDIEFNSTQIDEPTIAGTLEKVFLTSTDDLDSLIP